jgi:hypothetical protein
MSTDGTRQTFTAEQLLIAYQAVTMAEELVSDFYKMSSSQWLHPRYDVKTLADLSDAEIVDGPFAQVIRYEGQRKGSCLGSESYDFYKICLQDHAILAALWTEPNLRLMPFCLYIITHELIHIVRFSRFLQHFDASASEKRIEEHRVHQTTHDILSPLRMQGLTAVLEFYQLWRSPIENLSCPQL